MGILCINRPKVNVVMINQDLPELKALKDEEARGHVSHEWRVKQAAI